MVNTISISYDRLIMSNLYVVATPIGNLGDMTYRAVEVLKHVDMILCEDTRTTGNLLKHYDIGTKTMSYHANSDSSRTDDIITMFLRGQNLALVSDAGTPCVSDPGVQLIQKINKQVWEPGSQVEIIAVPGPSAVTAAVSIAGISGNQFVFMGFLPHKKGRQTLFNEIAQSERAVVFYESPHRIMKALESLNDVLDNARQVIICRELTKMHEQIVRGTVEEVLRYFVEHENKVRGEFVVVIDGK